MIVDTHTHLYLEEFEGDRHEAVRRALDAGVGHMVMPNVNLDTIEPMRRLQAAFPEQISMAMGLHPTELSDEWRRQLEQVRQELDLHPEYVAIGEVGIDLYWDASRRNEQLEVLDLQASWAKQMGLPIIIHCRNGLDEAVEVLEGHKGLRGVFHSFGGTVDDVEKIRSRVGDYYFGINGIVTFKNCGVRNVLPTIGLDRLVLETDAPYLAPVPHRGKRNESAYIVHTAAYVAHTLGLDLTEVEDATTRNAKALFKLGE